MLQTNKQLNSCRKTEPQTLFDLESEEGLLQ